MKKSTAFILILVLLFPLAVPTFAAGSVRATVAGQRLTVDGKYVDCEVYSVFLDDNVNGNNYFKLRDLAYMLNGTGSQFNVEYDGTINTIRITTGVPYVPDGSEMMIGTDKSATVKPSAQNLMIDGVLRSDLSAYAFSGASGDVNNFFKLRDLGSALGFGVDYDDATATMLVTTAGRTKRELTAEEIYAKCVPAVFYIEIYNDYGDPISSGSGFFIDSNGTAVTNYHVIYGASSAKISVCDTAGSTKDFDVLGVYDYNEYEDWAILKIDGSDFSYLEIGSPATAVGAATVYALGSPLGFSSTISQGLISNPARQVDGQVYIQTSAAISHGSSGGALLNKYGEVIGITSATFEEGQNLNLAIPISKISNINTTSYVPINETYTMPTGSLELDYHYVDLALYDYASIVITAKEFDCAEETGIYWDTDRPDLVYCTWGDDWDGDDIVLNIYSDATYGTALVWLVYHTESGIVLADDCITVNVAGGWIGPTDYADYYVEMAQGETRQVSITAWSYDGDSVYIHAFVDDPGFVGLEFPSGWNGDEMILQLNGLSAGSTFVNLELKNSETDEILATDYFYVEVT